MNNLMVFNNPEFGEIRTVEVDGEPWLVGLDVTHTLGYQNGSRDLNRHVDEEDKQNCQNDSIRNAPLAAVSAWYEERPHISAALTK